MRRNIFTPDRDAFYCCARSGGPPKEVGPTEVKGVRVSCGFPRLIGQYSSSKKPTAQQAVEGEGEEAGDQERAGDHAANGASVARPIMAARV